MMIARRLVSPCTPPLRDSGLPVADGMGGRRAQANQIKTPLLVLEKRRFRMKRGDVLLSHPVARAVPLGLEGLTSVFGMGTGVAPPLWSPRLSCQRTFVHN